MNDRLYLTIFLLLATVFLGLNSCINFTIPSAGPASNPATSPQSMIPSGTTISNSPSSGSSRTTNPSSSSPSPPTTLFTTPPMINLFTAIPNTIMIGGSSTLSWDVANASSLSITPGIGNVGRLTGSVRVTPNSTTDYTLTASNDVGNLTSTIEVVVGSSSN